MQKHGPKGKFEKKLVAAHSDEVRKTVKRMKKDLEMKAKFVATSENFGFNVGVREDEDLFEIDPAAPKKPRFSSYGLFANSLTSTLPKGLSEDDISKTVSDSWDALTEEELHSWNSKEQDELAKFNHEKKIYEEYLKSLSSINANARIVDLKALLQAKKEERSVLRRQATMAERGHGEIVITDVKSKNEQAMVDIAVNEILFGDAMNPYDRITRMSIDINSQQKLPMKHKASMAFGGESLGQDGKGLFFLLPKRLGKFQFALRGREVLWMRNLYPVIVKGDQIIRPKLDLVTLTICNDIMFFAVHQKQIVDSNTYVLVHKPVQRDDCRAEDMPPELGGVYMRVYVGKQEFIVQGSSPAEINYWIRTINQKRGYKATSEILFQSPQRQSVSPVKQGGASR